MKPGFILLAVCMATAAVAVSPLSIDSLAGVYKDRFENGLVDGTTFKSENVLEVVKISPSEAYIRAELEFYNGHSCSVAGIARVEGDALVYHPRENNAGSQCVLTLRHKGDRVVFGDADSACKMDFCGARGSFDGLDFAVSSRRTIRYMKRLLASQEYHQALAERDGRK